MSLEKAKPIVLVLCMLLAAPAVGEVDRVGSQTSAIWCADGFRSGHAERVTEVTVCQRNPGVPGPNQCPEFVDRVVLDFITENARAQGNVTVRIDHFNSQGELIESFKGEGELSFKSLHVDIDVDRAMLSGEWLQGEITVPKSARKLTRRQCATGSLTVLE